MKFNSYKPQCCGVTGEGGKDKLGKVYWSGFMKCNGHRLNCLKPHQFLIYRTDWCKYGYFFGMFDSIEKLLIEANVMTVLEEPEWKYKDGGRVKFESEAFVYKLTSKFYRLDMVFLGDEVGVNIDVDGDGHIGGDKVICEKGSYKENQQKSETFHSYWDYKLTW